MLARKNSSLRWLVLSLAAIAPISQAQDYPEVSKAIEALIPNAQQVAIAETPIPGVLEVQVDSDIIYLSADGSYLLQGKLFDLENRVDLTDQARSKIRRELLNGISESEQITFAPANPEHEVIIFTDVDCGYCRKLHEQIAQYNDLGIAVHYMMYPRSGVGSPSYDKAVSVWCSADQKTAMTDAKSGNDPVKRDCDNPVESQYRLGQKIGMTGTPAIITKDGTLIPGYVPPGALKQRLDALAAVSGPAS